jgi:hypothetical protein
MKKGVEIELWLSPVYINEEMRRQMAMLLVSNRSVDGLHSPSQ